jgi:predicted PurR-regulated permease PerM
MLGADPKVARAVWTVLLMAMILGGVWALRDLLFLLVLSLFFSYVLAPIVDWVDEHLPKRFKPNSLAKEIPLLIVYLALLAVIGFTLTWVASKALEQAGNLTASVPKLIENREKLMNWPVPEWAEPIRQSALDWLRGFLEGGAERALPLVKTVSAQLLSGIGNAVLLLLVPVFAFFFLKDGDAMAAAIIGRFAPEHRGTVGRIFGDLHRLLAQYMRALVLVSVITFVSYEVFYVVMGVPYSTLLAVLAGVLEAVPVVGPWTAAGVALVVAGTSGFQGMTAMVIFFVVYRLFNDYVIQPWLMSSGVAVHPLLVLAGLIAGEQIAGIPGMLLSLPFMAGLRVVYLRIEHALAREAELGAGS